MKALSPVALLGELTRIPSVNPEGEPGVDEPGEARLAGYLEKLLNDLGAEVWLREVLPGRPNVVARFPSDRAGKPRLLLAPHTDTVSVAGMTIDPFGGDVSEGKVWGRGASDTKGPMASMLCALSRLGEEIPKLGYEIWFAGLMGEESGQHGAKALASEENFDFVIAGEPTDLKTVHAQSYGGATALVCQINFGTTSGRRKVYGWVSEISTCGHDGSPVSNGAGCRICC